ncbi:hypothetical protein [Pseudomonas aeruginosa]|uniref:hypothetical protein n=1 Tax=Pseudomonas aeruginosa TaxID=287 RepID=UPI0039FD7795
MVDFAWSYLARLLTKPRIADALIRFAKRTPYLHLRSPDGSVYMERYWVFNPYDRVTNVPRWAPLIPFSIRVHHIRREDLDRHLHDHPWNARTIILKGWYIEKRHSERDWELFELVDGWRGGSELKWRRAGDTTALKTGQYHSICEVSDGGVYTLFISWKWRETWGFLVDGVKVPWREYLGLQPGGDLQEPKRGSCNAIGERVESELRIHGGKEFE